MTDPQGDAGPMSFLGSLGLRATQRAEPRASIVVAGAGCVLALVGVLMISGDAGSTDGDFNRAPGLILSALVVGAGYFTLAGAERGPLATGGTVAAALGVPPLMFFLTFDQDGLPPYSTEAILFVSTIAWLAAYAVGPGRGRPFLLGAGLLGLWASVLQLSEKLFDAPFLFFGAMFAFTSPEPTFDGGDDFGLGSFDAPDPSTIGVLSLGFGLAYVLLTRWLDRRGDHGAATPFALAALPALFVGTVAMGDDLEQAGTGVLAMAIGAALAHHGATAQRRATAWAGAAGVAIGAAVFLGDLTDDTTLVGLLYLTAGVGLVFAAHAYAKATGEPDELALVGATVAAATPGDTPSVPRPPPPPPPA
jgi:hypothetical protein